MTDLSKFTNPGVWAPIAQRLRAVRVQDFASLCVKMEGQQLEIVMRAYSLQSGVALRTVAEYWEVLNPDNKGPIYEKHGIIRVRKPFKRWIK